MLYLGPILNTEISIITQNVIRGVSEIQLASTAVGTGWKGIL